MTSPKNPSRKSVERFENEGGTTRAGELARKSRPRDFTQRAKTIMDIPTGAIPEAQGKASAAVGPGRRGGLKGGKARAP